jgi:hypothetical protein
VDDLARLQLRARRAGVSVTVMDPPCGLVELLELVGLSVEVLGQPEGGEQTGVEEVVMADDPAL